MQTTKLKKLSLSMDQRKKRKRGLYNILFYEQIINVKGDNLIMVTYVI